MKLLWTLSIAAIAVAATDHWPQFRGANHDGISPERILKQWNGASTNPVWRVMLTNALGSIAVSTGASVGAIAIGTVSLGSIAAGLLDAAGVITITPAP